MQLYLISLMQLIYPLHVSNKQIHHQDVISVHAAYSISNVSMGVWPLTRHEWNKGASCWSFSHMCITMHG